MNLTDKNFCYGYYSLLQVTYSRIQMIVLFSKCGLFKKLLIETTLKQDWNKTFEFTNISQITLT